jgi:hypothetical protein
MGCFIEKVTLVNQSRLSDLFYFTGPSSWTPHDIAFFRFAYWGYVAMSKSTMSKVKMSKKILKMSKVKMSKKILKMSKVKMSKKY